MNLLVTVTSICFNMTILCSIFITWVDEVIVLCRWVDGMQHEYLKQAFWINIRLNTCAPSMMNVICVYGYSVMNIISMCVFRDEYYKYMCILWWIFDVFVYFTIILFFYILFLYNITSRFRSGIFRYEYIGKTSR